MAAGAPGAAQIVQATGNLNDGVGQSFSSIAELIFGDATDLHASHRMLHAYPRPRQVAIVPFLARLQFRVLGLFLGCRCSRTAGA